MKVNGNNPYDQRVSTNDKLQTSEQSSGQAAPQKGERIKGEILDLNQNTAKIRLQNGRTVEAKLTDAFEMHIGQEVEFYVKDMDVDHWVLKPLLDAGASTADKLKLALIQAGFSVSETNMELVRKMIHANMSIDKEALQKVMMALKQFPKESAENILFLMKNDMPVTAENLKQLRSMQEGGNQLLTRLTDLSVELARNGRNPQVQGMILDAAISPETKAVLSALFESLEAAQSPDLPATSNFIKGEQYAGRMQQTGLMPAADMLNSTHATDDAAKANVLLAEHMAENSNAAPDSRLGAGMTMGEASTLKFPPNLMMSQDMRVMSDALRSMMASSPEQAVQLMSAETPQAFVALLSEMDLPPDMKNLLLDSLTEKIVYRQMTQELLLGRESLENPEALQSYYENLHDKLSLLAGLQASGENPTGGFKEAGQASGQLEFMSDLNQKFNYLQLPVMINDRLMHSELYVFNKKPQLKNPKSTLTCLIRLDLVNLGHLDTYITKTAENVSVQFYTQDDEKKRMLESYTSKLYNQLQKIGFKVTAMGVSTIKKDFDVMTDFLESGKDVQEIKRYTFDMRA